MLVKDFFSITLRWGAKWLLKYGCLANSLINSVRYCLKLILYRGSLRISGSSSSSQSSSSKLPPPLLVNKSLDNSEKKINYVKLKFISVQNRISSGKLYVTHRILLVMGWVPENRIFMYPNLKIRILLLPDRPMS